ncbi:hypothetical protein AURDEDRAFT_150428 [Auricularia subglabra TFB-10046 SS5]|nr:hypothetical protein AURDEDRAFT_150428 [Auricularia subglabra TFB-10046 SS5]
MPSPNRLALVAIAAVVALGRVLAGSVPPGQPCNPAATRLNPDTFQLESDCAFNAFCATNGTCSQKQCRRDEFAFGYAPSNSTTATAPAIPPLCPPGLFCADEEDKCRPLLPSGTLCQMNRDDECAPPPSSAHHAAGAISLCLNFTCTPATALVGDACTIDTQHHVWRGADGTTFGVTVSRDDCLASLAYCDDASRVCDTCSGSEGEEDSVCIEPPETPYRVSPLQYALAGAALVAGMLSLCGILIAINRHHRMVRRAAVEEYYREQTAYRNAINALIAAVATESAGTALVHSQYDDDEDAADDYDDRPLLQRSAPAVWKFGGGFE